MNIYAAFLEITIMLSGSFLIGFSMAWLYQREKLMRDKIKVANLNGELIKSKDQLHDLERKFSESERKNRDLLIYDSKLREDLKQCAEIRIDLERQLSKYRKKRKLRSNGKINGSVEPVYLNGKSKVKKAISSRRDDLKLLKGVGPVTEQRLYEIGISTYEQIGRLSKKEIEKVSDRIHLSADTFKANKWITQAKKLAKKVPS